MKILYIYKYGIIGGVCTQIFNRLTFLNPNVQVDLLFFQDYGAKKLFKHNTVFITKNLKEIHHIIKANGYELVTIIDTPESFAAIDFSDPIQPKVVIEVHTTTTNISYLAELRNNDHFLKHVSFIATPSKYLKTRIEIEFGFKGITPVYVIPNTLDMSLFTFERDCPTPTKRILAWVGKIDDHKNWKGFLEIASILSTKDPDYYFWVIGGYTAPIRRLEELLEMIHEKGLSEKLKWIPLINYKLMPRVYSLIKKSGGALVITSSNESFGMTMIEALSVGCPVIASNVGALPEILEIVSPDLLYPYGDYTSAVEKLENLFHNQELTRHLFNNNLNWIKEDYDIAPISEKYFNLIQSEL